MHVRICIWTNNYILLDSFGFCGVLQFRLLWCAKFTYIYTYICLRMYIYTIYMYIDIHVRKCAWFQNSKVHESVFSFGVVCLQRLCMSCKGVCSFWKLYTPTVSRNIWMSHVTCVNTNKACHTHVTINESCHTHEYKVCTVSLQLHSRKDCVRRVLYTNMHTCVQICNLHIYTDKHMSTISWIIHSRVSTPAPFHE